MIWRGDVGRLDGLLVPSIATRGHWIREAWSIVELFVVQICLDTLLGEAICVAIDRGTRDLTVGHGGIMCARVFANTSNLFWRWCDPLGGLPGKHAGDVHRIWTVLARGCVKAMMSKQRLRTDLFQRPALSFDDEKVDNQTTEEVACRKDIAQAEVDTRCDERGEEGQEKVPQPVAGSGQSHALRPVAGRV